MNSLQSGSQAKAHQKKKTKMKIQRNVIKNTNSTMTVQSIRSFCIIPARKTFRLLDKMEE